MFTPTDSPSVLSIYGSIFYAAPEGTPAAAAAAAVIVAVVAAAVAAADAVVAAAVACLYCGWPCSKQITTK